METAILEAQLLEETDLLHMFEEWESRTARSHAAAEGRFRTGGALNLSMLGDDICKTHFRFTWGEMHQLADALKLPETIVCDNDVKVDRMTALAMLLRRLIYPARLVDMELMFGWESTRFSRISRTTAYFIFKRWRHVLKFDKKRLTASRLRAFADAIHLKGAPLDNCWGFIDGTLRSIARPVRNQRIVFNGWKRVHALKYQIVSTPDGLVVHVYGPIEGRRHDLTVFRLSDLERILELHSHGPDGENLCIYGDPAYGLSQHMQSPFKGNVTDEQGRYNTRMSKVRESVEWAFGHITQLFAFLDFKKNQKVLLQPVGIYYLVAILLANAHSIFTPNKTAVYFDCMPPTLSEYLNGEPLPEDDDTLIQAALESSFGEFDVHHDMVDFGEGDEMELDD